MERLEWCGETSGDAAELCSGGYGEGSGTTSDDREEYYAICGQSDERMGTVIEHDDPNVYVLWADGSLDDGMCGAIS